MRCRLTRQAFLLSAIAVLLASGAMPQETDDVHAGEDEHAGAEETGHSHEHHTHEVETFSHTVTVTGSWIPGTPENAAQPVSVLSRDDLEAEGSPTMLGWNLPGGAAEYAAVREP